MLLCWPLVLRKLFITMPIVGAYVFPHGAITLDPENRDFDGIPAAKPTSKEECIKLHKAISENAASLVSTLPDLIILSTPHGLRLEDDFLLLGNSKVYLTTVYSGYIIFKITKCILGYRKR